MEARVRVATCRDSAEAALVRSLLDGHGIAAVVAGEHHAAMLGGLGTGFVSLDVWVAREDAEQAVELIRSLREEGEVAPIEEELDDDADDGAGPHWGLEQRRRTGAAVLLALLITFGTGHLYARSVGWALALATIELIGILQLDEHRALGASLVVGAILTDLVGAVIRIRRAIADEQLPKAWRVR